ncbi:hypothetical protein WJX81_007439 [Elliptochloris bilobata]|uniref:AP2/ERF domain-containing protein n=1 Tax=Elliptochloris bilobata TaxID=381761 RepID=A0AAW1R0E6_9CHLO
MHQGKVPAGAGGAAPAAPAAADGNYNPHSNSDTERASHKRGPRGNSSRFRGVTRHRRTRRWEAHIWDNKKQVYLGGYDSEEHAGKAHDVMALKCRGGASPLNFAMGEYAELLPMLAKLSKEEVVLLLRRQSKGFARDTSRARAAARARPRALAPAAAVRAAAAALEPDAPADADAPGADMNPHSPLGALTVAAAAAATAPNAGWGRSEAPGRRTAPQRVATPALGVGHLPPQSQSPPIMLPAPMAWASAPTAMLLDQLCAAHAVAVRPPASGHFAPDELLAFHGHTSSPALRFQSSLGHGGAVGGSVPAAGLGRASMAGGAPGSPGAGAQAPY